MKLIDWKQLICISTSCLFSLQERKQNISSLIEASYGSKSMLQITRTLKFLRDKIKNETWENRGEVVKLLLETDEMAEDLKSAKM